MIAHLSAIGALAGARGPARPLDDASAAREASRHAVRWAHALGTTRRLFGLFLILHGVAHARAGTALADPSRSWGVFEGSLLASALGWITAGLWAVAMLGFIAGGLGLLGVAGLRRRAEPLVFVAACASGLMLLLAVKPYTMMGAGIDIALLLLAAATGATRFRGEWIWRPTLFEAAALHAAPPTRARLVMRTIGNVAGWVFLVYVAVIGGVRPWHLTWGATEAELTMSLPGDGLAPRTASTHAVTIEAPVAAVWPWLVQIGQDRGGFYSHTWIENGLLGAGIRNADRIHPEWQTLEAGDFVRSARTDWLGGRYADRTGWRVIQVEPQRSLTLLGWGTFALLPVDSNTTRLVIRTRSAEHGILSAPLDFLVFEPGHFIMERAMMLGIRQRAERAAAGGG